MAEPNRGPYHQDPWNDIIAIHFPGDTKITKLDFVKHRYMVAGKDQEIADVIDQPALRLGSDGLKLLIDPAGVVSIGAERVHLKNKTSAPNLENPGALNEFLYLNYTLVFEFSWIDMPAALDDQSPGGFGTPPHLDVLYEVLSYYLSDQAGNTKLWAVGNPMDTFAATDPIPEHDETTYYPYTTDGRELYDTGYSDFAALYNYWYNFQIMAGTSPIYMPDPFLQAGGTYWGLGERFDNAGIAKGPGPWYVWTSEINQAGIFAPTQPPDDEQTIHYNEIPGQDAYSTIVPFMAVYEGNDDADVTSRIIGGTADLPEGGSTTVIPLNNSTLPAPYGINRIAINMSASRLVASINGSNPVAIEVPSLFTQPQVPTAGGPPPPGTPKYFDNPLNNFNQRFHRMMMQFPGHMRCMWLFRKRKADKTLKSMSVVQPLPDADSKLWKKPPGQDQQT